MKRICFICLLSLFLTSCSQLEEKMMFNYPGDRFSRTLASAKCQKISEGIYEYDMPQGKVILNVSATNAFLIDTRKGDLQKEPLSNFWFYGKVDSSLRYFLRETMTISHLKKIFGPKYERWGGVASAMLVWPMIDGRHLAILPSALEMPEGMNSYNILSQYKKLDRNVRLLKLGEQSK